MVAPGAFDHGCVAYIKIHVFCHGVVLRIQEGFEISARRGDKGPCVNQQRVIGTKDYTECTSLCGSLAVVHARTHTHTHTLSLTHAYPAHTHTHTPRLSHTHTPGVHMHEEEYMCQCVHKNIYLSR